MFIFKLSIFNYVDEMFFWESAQKKQSEWRDIK